MDNFTELQNQPPGYKLLITKNGAAFREYFVSTLLTAITGYNNQREHHQNG